MISPSAVEGGPKLGKDTRNASRSEGPPPRSDVISRISAVEDKLESGKFGVNELTRPFFRRKQRQSGASDDGQQENGESAFH